jgi:hypothetical protein
MARPLRWHRVIPEMPRAERLLWVFPLVAGTTWFTTITILLLRWLWIGQPRYPGQVNPDVPFISDIAAFTLKPVFVTGCTVTGLAFAAAVFGVHHVRYSPRFYALSAADAPWRHGVSFVALVAGLLAALALFFLSLYDTFNAHALHARLLVATFVGLGLTALTTSAVWWDQVI